MSRPKREIVPFEYAVSSRGRRTHDAGRPRCLSLTTLGVDADGLDWLRYPINEVLLAALIVALHEGTTWSTYELLGCELAGRMLRYVPLAAGAPSANAYQRLLEGVGVDELKFLLTIITATTLYEGGDGGGDGAVAAQAIVDEGVLDQDVTGAVRAFAAWDASRCERLFVEVVDGEVGGAEVRAAQAWLADTYRDLTGAVVVADAPFACPETARAIAVRGADYVLSLAEGHEVVEERLSDPHVLEEVRNAGIDYLCETRTGRRAVEVRETYRLDLASGTLAEWDGLRSVVCQVTTTTATRRGSTPKVEVSSYVTTLASVADIAEALGQHRAMVTGNGLLERAWGTRDTEACESRGLVSRTLLEKLAKALGKIAQSDPSFEGASVHSIRMMLNLRGEEAIARLFEAAGPEGFVDAVEALKVTAYDRRRYQEKLDMEELDICYFS